MHHSERTVNITGHDRLVVTGIDIQEFKAFITLAYGSELSRLIIWVSCVEPVETGKSGGTGNTGVRGE